MDTLRSFDVYKSSYISILEREQRVESCLLNRATAVFERLEGAFLDLEEIKEIIHKMALQTLRFHLMTSSQNEALAILLLPSPQPPDKLSEAIANLTFALQEAEKEPSLLEQQIYKIHIIFTLHLSINYFEFNEITPEWTPRIQLMNQFSLREEDPFTDIRAKINRHLTTISIDR